jgi:hypothetical protein
MQNKEEIIKKFENVFAEYQKDPDKAKRIEQYRRKYSKLTAEDLLKSFTI